MKTALLNIELDQILQALQPPLLAVPMKMRRAMLVVSRIATFIPPPDIKNPH
jgi:hypothetical protein